MTIPAPAPTTVHEDVAMHLADQGVGTYLTDIVPGERPDRPHRVLAVQHYGGDPPRLLDARNIPHDERLAVQIMARALSDVDAYAFARAAYLAVPFRHATLASGARYAWCRAEQVPALIGLDDADRVLVGFNVTLRRHYP